jgi:hypothetical protein
VIRVSAVRFVLAVSPSPAWMRIAFGVAVLVGWTTLWMNPADVDSALGTILLLQMFSASSGYVAVAARGFLDPLLISGRPLFRIALSHFASSAVPGVLAWFAIAGFAAAAGSHAALSLHRHAALLIVSAVAWAAGLAMPRLTAGALWASVLVAFALSRGALGDYFIVVQSASGGLRHAMAAASAFVVCPFLLLGDFAAAADPLVIGLDVAVAAGVACVGIRFITRREYSLVEPG